MESMKQRDGFRQSVVPGKSEIFFNELSLSFLKVFHCLKPFDLLKR